MGVCNCSMFCCMLLYVHSGVAVVLVGGGGLVALLGLSSWGLVMVGRLFLAVPWGCLRFVIVVFPDHTHLLFFSMRYLLNQWMDSNQTCIDTLLGKGKRTINFSDLDIMFKVTYTL